MRFLAGRGRQIGLGLLEVWRMNAKPLAEALEEAFVRCRDMDASLAERLQAFANTVTRLEPEFQDAVDRLIARLKAHSVGQNAPRPGEPMARHFGTAAGSILDPSKRAGRSTSMRPTSSGLTAPISSRAGGRPV